VAQPEEPVRTIIVPAAPVRPIAPPEGADPRQVLAETLSEKSAADTAALAARAALDRADVEVAEAVAALECAEGADQAAIATAAKRLAAWLSSGEGHRPSAPGGAGSAARAEAEAEVGAARAARESLASSLEDARAAVNHVEQRIIGAIESIIVEAATDDAARLAALLAAIAELSTRLVGVTALTWSLPGRVTRPIALPRSVLDAVRNSGATVTPAARSVWEAFAARLRDDPAAQRDPPLQGA